MTAAHEFEEGNLARNQGSDSTQHTLPEACDNSAADADFEETNEEIDDRGFICSDSRKLLGSVLEPRRVQSEQSFPHIENNNADPPSLLDKQLRIPAHKDLGVLEGESHTQRTTASDRRPQVSSRAERLLLAARSAAPPRISAVPEAPTSPRTAAMDWLAEERCRPRPFGFPEPPAATPATAPAGGAKAAAAASTVTAAGDGEAAAKPAAEDAYTVPLEEGLRELLRAAEGG